MRSEDFRADTKRPFTGAEYLASLRDGREVYINGERVADVTSHPAMRNSARSLARLYDALHDPNRQAALTAPTDTGSGGYTHKYFRVAHSAADLAQQQTAIADWSRMSYGWMGRTPDYKAALMNTLGANAEWYGPFKDNALAWHKRAQEAVLFMNHAIVNPPIDRHKPAEAVKDVFVHITKENDAGIWVSGAKVVATSSALTHYNFLAQSSATVTEDPSLSVMFIVPMNAPGIKMFCRVSYEQTANTVGQPFDYPLSSRFDENDAILVLDNVFIPWEDVLVLRDAQKILSFHPASGFMHGYCFQGCTRFTVKLDFLCGLLAKALRATGGDAFRGNQAALGEVIALRHMFWSFSNAMAHNPIPWASGAVLPNLEAALFLPHLHVGGLSARHRHGAPGDRLGADLPAVLGQGFRQSGDRPLPGAICARLQRHGPCRAHQDHEAVVGRNRHRIRRPPRALRAQLCRCAGRGAAAGAEGRRARRPAEADGGAGRPMHGRL